MSTETGQLHSGTQLDIKLYSSDNLDDWYQVGSTSSPTAVGINTTSFLISGGDNFGRYVRLEFTLVGSNSYVNFSLFLNTHAAT